jgi:hypothetical protein
MDLVGRKLTADLVEGTALITFTGHRVTDRTLLRRTNGLAALDGRHVLGVGSSATNEKRAKTAAVRIIELTSGRRNKFNKLAAWTRQAIYAGATGNRSIARRFANREAAITAARCSDETYRPSDAIR